MNLLISDSIISHIFSFQFHIAFEPDPYCMSHIAFRSIYFILGGYVRMLFFCIIRHCTCAEGLTDISVNPNR